KADLVGGFGTGVVRFRGDTLLEQSGNFRPGLRRDFGNVSFGLVLTLGGQLRYAPCQKRGVFFDHFQQTLGTADSMVNRKHDALLRWNPFRVAGDAGACKFLTWYAIWQSLQYNREFFGPGESHMAKPVPIGARASAEQTVEFKHTLTAFSDQLPPVYSTPDMIRLMETAAFYALQPYCEGDEITVGTSINVEHRAASGVGAHI